MSDSNAIDLRAARERREALRESAEKARANGVEVSADLEAFLARLQAAAPPDAAERAAEYEERRRRDDRVERLRSAGIRQPASDTPQEAAFLRVVAATTPVEAAVANHPGSVKAMRAVAGWLERGAAKPTVLLSGPTGRGKTVAAWYALATYGGVYLRCGDVEPTDRWAELRVRAARSRLLVVDDLTERLTAWQAAQLADVIERRHDEGLRTLLTSNLPEAKVEAVLGARVVSRLGQGAVIEVEGADLRSGR
jgi:hypothetical protein